MLIYDEVFKNHLIGVSKKLADDISDNAGKKFNCDVLDTIDELSNIIQVRHNESLMKAEKELCKDLSLLNLGIISIGLLSILIELEEVYPKPIKSDWLDNLSDVDANFTLMSLLTQLTNYLLSFSCLIKSGFSSSSQIISRTICELSWLILVITADKDKMVKYVSGVDEKDEKEIWYKYFKPKHLFNSLSNIEKMFLHNEKVNDNMDKFRREIYEFYSSLVHNSFTFCAVNCYSIDNFNDDKLEYNIFGKYSIAMKNTIKKINIVVFYFLNMIMPIFHNIHDFHIPINNEFWMSFIVLRHGFINCYLNTYDIK